MNASQSNDYNGAGSKDASGCIIARTVSETDQATWFGAVSQLSILGNIECFWAMFALM